MQNYKMLSVCVLYQNVGGTHFGGTEHKIRMQPLSDTHPLIQHGHSRIQTKRSSGLPKDIFRGPVMWTWSWSTGQRHALLSLRPKSPCDFS